MSGASHDEVERVAQFILDEARATAPRRWLQGAIPAPPPCSDRAGPATRLLCARRLRKVPAAVHAAVAAWSRGERDVVLFDGSVPDVGTVLSLQARGARCVSLLRRPHEGQTPLEFVAHDLCHLEKLFDPHHFVGQVGFFAKLHRARVTGSDDAGIGAAGPSDMGAGLDARWHADAAHVLADMNGSPVYLLAALGARLTLALHRAGRAGERCAQTRALLDLVGLTGTARHAALALLVGGRRSSWLAAVARHFERGGRLALAAARASDAAHYQ